MDRRKLFHIRISKKDLEREYIKNKKSVSACARLFHTSYWTVKKRLKHFGLPFFPERQFNPGRRVSNWPQLADKEWLAKELQHKSMLQISREVGTTNGNVSYFVNRHGLRPNHYTYSEAYRAGIRKARHNAAGDKASNWKGGRIKTGGGHIYVYSPEHPYATQDGYVMEHRLVMEKHLGRYLTRKEIVHHKDHVKTNNVITNLKLMTLSEHRRFHLMASSKLYEAEQEIIRLKAILEANGISY